MKNPVPIELALKEEKHTIRHRRALHKTPELGEDLIKTTSYIKSVLENSGIPYWMTSNMGIVAEVSGKPAPSVLAIRADMDALPIKEETGLKFSSENNNMHACGHDAHSAILLSTLEILHRNKDLWKGKIIGLFQPAEETTGGAEKMIQEGCLEKHHVDAVIGLHIGSLFPDVKSGFIGIRKGPIMASVDSFNVKVIGKGGHGARPHECIDPILATCEMIMSLQKIVSRNLDPIHGAVISIGMMNAGTIVNVIPDESNFSGTIRILESSDRQKVESLVYTTIRGIAEAHSCKAEITYNHYYPATINNEKICAMVRSEANSLFSPSKVVEIDRPSMGTEDFSYFAQARPSCYFILGSWKKALDNQYYPHHNSKFDINEEHMKKGVALFLACAFRFSDFLKDNNL